MKHKCISFFLLYMKDYVNERIRKIGGNTPFNMFLAGEPRQLQKVLAEIKRYVICKCMCALSD